MGRMIGNASCSCRVSTDHVSCYIHSKTLCCSAESTQAVQTSTEVDQKAFPKHFCNIFNEKIDVGDRRTAALIHFREINEIAMFIEQWGKFPVSGPGNATPNSNKLLLIPEPPEFLMKIRPQLFE